MRRGSSILRGVLAAGIVACLSRSSRAEDVLGVASASGAPQSSHADRPYWRTNLFTRVLRDQKYLVTDWWPREFRRPAFAVPLLATTVVALTAQDREEEGFGDSMVGSSADDRSAGPGGNIAANLTRLGNGPEAFALLGITYLASRGRGNDRLAATSSLSVEALINAGIWSEVIKRTFARSRPSEVNEGKFFQYGQSESTSFPSGHAMGAFAVAAVFAETYPEKRWMPWLAYGTATLIGGSRIALGRHFPSDVLVGALLGNSIGHGVVARGREADAQRRHSWTRRLTPFVEPARAGYGVVYAFGR